MWPSCPHIPTRKASWPRSTVQHCCNSPVLQWMVYLYTSRTQLWRQPPGAQWLPESDTASACCSLHQLLVSRDDTAIICMTTDSYRGCYSPEVCSVVSRNWPLAATSRICVICVGDRPSSAAHFCKVSMDSDSWTFPRVFLGSSAKA